MFVITLSSFSSLTLLEHVETDLLAHSRSQNYHPVASCFLFLCCLFLTNRSSSSSGPGLELTAHEGSQAEEKENTPEKKRNTLFSPLSPPWQCIPIRQSTETESVRERGERERDETILSKWARERERERGRERELVCMHWRVILDTV